jgi:hypothetical protein
MASPFWPPPWALACGTLLPEHLMCLLTHPVDPSYIVTAHLTLLLTTLMVLLSPLPQQPPHHYRWSPPPPP